MEEVVAAASWLTEGFVDAVTAETAYGMLKAVDFAYVLRPKGGEEDNHTSWEVVKVHLY
ncbi:hypothetical protein TSUD_224630 [Trifolium subterraneum]|uniref:Uncharacterized protein n=1 Tax=Trifolium subterraneum TaxID=3900 RepID=A0A2Z6MM06_TRISU|nr:hypothetical protein TSUD_224630 [Trifolium subterraneum]